MSLFTDIPYTGLLFGLGSCNADILGLDVRVYKIKMATTPEDCFTAPKHVGVLIL